MPKPRRRQAAASDKPLGATASKSRQEPQRSTVVLGVARSLPRLGPKPTPVTSAIHPPAPASAEAASSLAVAVTRLQPLMAQA